jgi:capsular exopolysaccharide synthesis family protein
MSEHQSIDLAPEPTSGARLEGQPPRQAASRYVAPPSQDDAHLLDRVKVLYKRRHIAAAVFVAVLLGTAAYTFTATPVFEARTELLIEAENPNVVSFKEVIDQEKATNDYYQTQYRILQSRSLARKTLDQQKLWALFVPKPAAEQHFSIRRAVTQSIASVVHLVKPAKPSIPDAGETAEQSAAIDAFMAHLTVTPIRASRLVDIKYESTYPDVAAQVANALAHAYIEQNLDFRYTSSRDASDWLGEQLAAQRKKVEASEAALLQYREKNDALSLEERQNIVVQKLADLNAAVTRAKTERIQKETAYQQIAAVRSDREALDTIPTILANQFIQQQKAELANLVRQQAQLSEKLGPNHPEMAKVRLAIETAQSRIDGEVAKSVQALKNDAAQAKAQEESLVRALEQQKREALDLNQKGIAYGSLERDAASNRQIFEALMQRTKETGISEQLKASNIRIVDAAEVPRSPVSPNSRTNLLLAVVGGFTLAVCSAFFVDYLDNRITLPTQIRSHLGLPCLGMIPAITTPAEGASANPLLIEGVQASFAEAFRGVRTSVLFSSIGDGGRSLAVTSTGPGEGKTVVSSNLALALAQTGQRVLLIDADMRRPRVHEVFGLQQEPGLSNVLVGDAKVSEATQQISAGGLWVMPAGHIPPNPAELLGSARFEQFIENLKKHFAWVVIDTPPVMPVTDAPIVAHIASGTIFVVGAEMTSHRIARAAVEQLADANGRLLGAILNRVDLDNHSYYYSQYYRKEYGEYYVKSA